MVHVMDALTELTIQFQWTCHLNKIVKKLVRHQIWDHGVVLGLVPKWFETKLDHDLLVVNLVQNQEDLLFRIIIGADIYHTESYCMSHTVWLIIGDSIRWIFLYRLDRKIKLSALCSCLTIKVSSDTLGDSGFSFQWEDHWTSHYIFRAATENTTTTEFLYDSLFLALSKRFDYYFWLFSSEKSQSCHFEERYPRTRM